MTIIIDKGEWWIDRVAVSITLNAVGVQVISGPVNLGKGGHVLGVIMSPSGENIIPYGVVTGVAQVGGGGLGFGQVLTQVEFSAIATIAAAGGFPVTFGVAALIIMGP